MFQYQAYNTKYIVEMSAVFGVFTQIPEEKIETLNKSCKTIINVNIM